MTRFRKKRRIEDKVPKLEELFAIFDGAEVGLYVTDMDTYEVLFVNEYFRREFGDDLVGRKCWDVFQGRTEVPCEFCTNPELVDEYGMPTGPLVWQFFNEKVQKWFRCVDNAIEWPDGKLVRFEITIDITDQKDTEADLFRQKELLRTVVDTTPGLIFVKDKDARYHLANAALADLFGYPPEEVVGQTDTELVPLENERLQYSADDLEVIRSLEKKFIPEERRTCLDGSIRWFQTTKMPLRINGNGTYVLGVSEDITTRKKIEEELIRSNSELEEFSRIVSHDLQEPLRTIRSYSQMLSRSLNGDSEDQKRYLDYIIRGTQKMSKFIQDLLLLSRVSIDPIEMNQCNLNDVLDSVLFDFRQQIKETDADIEVCNLPPVKAYRTHMEQLIGNLISNAIKYRHRGKPCEIRIYSEIIDGLEYVSIKDNGIGIKEEHKSEIFKPFRRLHEPSEYSGSGVGLTICKRIVERHNGHIVASSEYGKGSKFSFAIGAE